MYGKVRRSKHLVPRVVVLPPPVVPPVPMGIVVPLPSPVARLTSSRDPIADRTGVRKTSL